MRAGRFAPVLMVVWAGFCSAAKLPESKLSKLKAEADRVLQLSAVDARGRIGAVFAYADALKETGLSKEAMKYYKLGLRRHAWSLRHQLAYAQLLMKHGDKELARERAKLVADFAERDKLVIPALKLLGREKEGVADFPAIAKRKDSKHALVLVPMGDVDVLILKAVQEGLRRELGIPVEIQKANLRIPKFGRDQFKEFVEQLRAEILKLARLKPVQGLMEEAKVALEDVKKDDEVVLSLYAKLLARYEGEEGVRKFAATCADLKNEGKQWKAEELVAALRSAARPHKRLNVRYLAVTKLGMYDEGSSFLFGLRIGEYAVMSYRRFTAEFNNQRPNRRRLIERALKQCLASAAHVFGMEHCSNPTCARAYPHSLSEHDAKSASFCARCKKAFTAALQKGR